MISSHIINAKDLSNREKSAMYALFESYYSAVTFEQFHSDLNTKHYCILLKSVDEKIQGFTTLEVIPFCDNSDANEVDSAVTGVALYSGDTILHHDYWGDQTLPWAWCKLAGKLKAQAPETPLYWFLIVKGHKTYRYLPIFTRRFYPNHKVSTPTEMQIRIDLLARKKFGDAYKPESGIIQFDKSKGHLNDALTEIPSHLIKNPHVSFFLEKNKHYDNGDELVCITELCESNMRFHAKSAFLDGLQEDSLQENSCN